jgi:tetratricopeptide (TPR) repeat protein
MPRLKSYAFAMSIFLLTGAHVNGQTGFQIKIDKPEEYQERILRSEKTPEKKIRTPQRILQNTITRYNYFFNASNKLNEVIERAKQAFQDDYTKLLPFYNYALEKTAADGVQLDSIIWKSNSGIVLHDLRNDWIDDLYLLWGASYYFQQKHDSARILFQFINQSFAPREKDGSARAIGSARDGNSALQISSPEKKGMIRKMFSAAPPRRNDAFIWQIRNYIATEQFAEAASLIEALQRDPAFPTRLQEELHEVQAWWYYRQQNWDSTARHLSQALGLASNQNERARWEYLLGQLYEQTGKWAEAEKFYSRCIPRTTNPILEIYARLGSIRTNRNGESDVIADNIRELKQMAKRDKYTDYRDIIYFMAAQMQSQTGDRDATKALLLSSTAVPSNNQHQRNQAFEQLARICLDQKEYREAYNFYDSIQLNDPKLVNPDSIRSRKELLGIIATQLEIIERQDSLLKIVSLPEDQRKEFIRKLAKELRRKQGLKDEFNSGPKTGGTGVFAGGGEAKGEWYFYNAGSKSRGLSEFQARWGNRPNADNWRRSAALSNARQPTTGGGTIPGGGLGTPSDAGEISFETLYASLPMSTEQQKILNDSLQQAWFTLGKTYIQRMEDCANGVAALEKITEAYPAFQPMDEALFLLYYCYQRNNQSSKAETIRTRLEKDFPGSEKTSLIVTGKDPAAEKKKEATRIYQSVYDQFIAGHFEKALQLKQSADSVYGKSYWTPQLIYIEAVYHVRQRADSIARKRLGQLMQDFPTSPLSKKAETLLRVLTQRDSIERELISLNIEPPAKTSIDSSLTKKQTIKQPSTPPTIPKPPSQTDTTRKSPPPALYKINPDQAHQVVVVLQEVDVVFATEAKNSLFRFNRSRYYNQQYNLEIIKLNDKQQLILISPFNQLASAVNYLSEAKRLAPTEIFPWLSVGRYRFGVIDSDNLRKIQEEKSYEGYEQFLLKEHPGILK